MNLIRNILEASPSIEAVIFDFDGTLYDKKWFALRLIANNITNLFLLQNERKTRKELRGAGFGNSELFYAQFFQCFSRQFKNRKYSPAFLKEWYFEEYMLSLIQILQKYYHARSDAKPLFELLHEQNIKFAVLSDYPCVAERMRAIGIEPAFNGKFEIACYACEDFGALKPNKIPFLEVARQLNTAPEKILVVGDKNETDGQGAKNAGMRFLDVCLLFTLSLPQSYNH
ncbi:MAG: HAD family hydrolase [Bacteroidales bacterium]|jgi:HAD superfamily hydrolase (TIGR01549 family)|nr:HAD family hydrolase [Bacteroidales bacterium]